MLSKEEYKKQLVRMWDSLRKSRYKGREDCRGVYCNECPFEPYCENGNPKMIDVAEIVEIVENWAKNHPVVTNADKFEETFGFKAPMNRCIQSDVYCAECKVNFMATFLQWYSLAIMVAIIIIMIILMEG